MFREDLMFPFTG